MPSFGIGQSGVELFGERQDGLNIFGTENETEYQSRSKDISNGKEKFEGRKILTGPRNKDEWR